MSIGRLKKIELREFWRHEAVDFTQWLAMDENLYLLSEAISIDIKLIQTEASVGKFNVDILAEEENTGRKIVIENQLETTNHDHLGKIITYASGFDAEIIIWIAKEIRDEHRQAVEWINDHSDNQLNIFAIEIELWQIENSPYAPNFKIVSKPNDWAKAVKQSTIKSELTDRKLMQLEFWTQFKEYALNQNTNLRLRKVYPQHWYDISIGNSKSHITLVIDADNEQIRCEFYIPDAMEVYEYLLTKKDIIENSLNYELEWMELEGKKASRIRTIKEIDVADDENWNESFEWFMKTSQDFQLTFSEELKKMNHKKNITT
ncbi:MAG: DUF4268 domain-containing protein [Flexistipes sinusarabici]|uniref:DUF4268 domain-containing protein n=1 Tax=Flexistipes sinusarabici TaxID=2352 RepID=A0A5D0MFB4_FLESI|nr:DUF4268 domain-containing protein [Flexistipes sinusarabici]TYB32384.1 MAG: DUF4268 domain-containing protein [Flexistipes sinusarabici]